MEICNLSTVEPLDFHMYKLSPYTFSYVEIMSVAK